jgi:hypothetical protein
LLKIKLLHFIFHLPSLWSLNPKSKLAATHSGHESVTITFVTAGKGLLPAPWFKEFTCKQAPQSSEFPYIGLFIATDEKKVKADPTGLGGRPQFTMMN